MPLLLLSGQRSIQTSANARWYSGEDDPEFTYKVYNYNNLKDDIGSFFNITIEKIEKDGEYELVPKFELKDESNIVFSFINDVNRGSIQYLFNNLGRIIVVGQGQQNHSLLYVFQKCY